MTKSSERRKEMVKATQLAFTVANGRRQLVKLKYKAERNGKLSKQKLARAKSLIWEVKAAKAELIELGFDPNEAVKWASVQKRLGSSKKVAKPKGNRNDAGVGMYSLGSSLKVWR